MGRGWRIPAVHVCYHSDPYMIDGLCALKLELGWTWMSVWRPPQRLGRCYASQWAEGNPEPCRIMMIRTEAEQPLSFRSYGTAAELLKAWFTAHVGVIHWSSWIVGAILCLHSNQLQWALTRAPLSRDCRVDRAFPMGRWSLPVLPCLLPWGWMPTKRNTPNHLWSHLFQGPRNPLACQASVPDEPQVDHSNGPSSPKQQRLTNLIRTLGFRKSAAQWMQGI